MGEAREKGNDKREHLADDPFRFDPIDPNVTRIMHEALEAVQDVPGHVGGGLPLPAISGPKKAPHLPPITSPIKEEMIDAASTFTDKAIDACSAN